jgi:hypothetical protein
MTKVGPTARVVRLLITSISAGAFVIAGVASTSAAYASARPALHHQVKPAPFEGAPLKPAPFEG